MYKLIRESKRRSVIVLSVMWFFLLLTLNGNPAYLWSADDKAIFWYSDMHQASINAIAANRPMMLVFWASWCEPCRLMDEQVFPDPAVVQGIARGFIPMRINADIKETLKNKYNVTTLPTIIFTDSYGTELFRHSGYISAASLNMLLIALPADVTRINLFDRDLAQDKNNFDALNGMASELQQDALYRLSNAYWERALKLGETNQDAGRRESILTAIALNSLKLEESEKALNLFKKCLKEFPSSPNRASLLLGLGQAYALLGEEDKAHDALQMVIEQYPQSEAAQTARKTLSSREH
jgi:tetratricopeptide (TPR) repeat protein